MFILGVAYEQGTLIPKDQEEAVNWYRKAAELGDESAMINLGEAYKNGHGVPQDHVEAVNWYRKAAELGSVRALRSFISNSRSVVFPSKMWGVHFSLS